MEEKTIITEQFRPTIEALAVGEYCTFPLEKLRTIRATCSDLGLVTGRRYKTKSDRKSRTVTATRVE